MIQNIQNQLNKLMMFEKSILNASIKFRLNRLIKNIQELLGSVSDHSSPVALLQKQIALMVECELDDIRKGIEPYDYYQERFRNSLFVLDNAKNYRHLSIATLGKNRNH